MVRPRLLKLPGIAEVIIMGGDIKQYQVLVDPAKLQEYNVSLQEIEAAIKANNLNTSGGFLEEGQTERPVRIIGRLGPLPQQVVDDLLKVPVKMNADRAVLLRHVATVEKARRQSAATPASTATPASSSRSSSSRTPTPAS